MAIGHQGGSFATTDKSPNYMSGALSANADLKYKYDVLNQDKADKENQAKVAEAKIKADALKENKMPDFKTVTSLNSNIEKAKYKITNDAVQNYLALDKEISSSNDPSKISELKAKQSQLKANFDVYNDFSVKVNDSIKYLTEHQEDYDPDSYQEQMSKLLMAGKGYTDITLDKNNNPIFSLTDPDGNVIKGEENKTLASFMLDISTNSMKKSTFDEDINDTIAKLGVKTQEDDKGILTTVKIAPTPESIKTAKETFFNDFLNDRSSRYRLAKDNNIDINDVPALKQKVDEIFDSKVSKTNKNLINTAQENYLAGRTDEATRKKEKNESEQSFTTTPEIPLHFTNAGVKQGRDLTMVIENGKAKPSLSFTDKNTGKVINLQNVVPQKISRIKKWNPEKKKNEYVYVTEVSHLKPTKIYAEGGEKTEDGKTAKKGDVLGIADVQTSEVVTLREANALNLLKSKTIKTKEDLRNVFPKENVQQKTETNSIPTYSVSDLKSNGWNDSQIRRAVKEGKIKTK